MSGTPLARYAGTGRLAVAAQVEQQNGVDVIVAGRLAFRSGSVWIDGRIDETLSSDDKQWRSARTAFASIAISEPKLPMPDRPLGDGEPIGIDLIGDIGNRADDLGFIRQHRDASIIIHIDSRGGVLSEARRIYAILARHECAVLCNISVANSAAALVALAGDIRSIAADGQMLLHPPGFSAL